MPSQQVRFQITVRGLREMTDSFRDVARPGFETTTKLESALDATFADTQERVHRITNTLALSGEPDTHFDGDTWSGEITYGSKPDHDAYYAIYELARGGSHNFFAGTTDYESRFEEAIDDHFRRTL